MGSPERKGSRVVSARVINDQHTAYVVGTREQALAEAVEIRAGKR
jgi:hypothetical protein